MTTPLQSLPPVGATVTDVKKVGPLHGRVPRLEAEAKLAAIDAACLEVCGDNHESTVGADGVDQEMGRYVCIGESGDPVIDEDEPAEVVRRLSRVWELMQERAELAEARVVELEAKVAAFEVGTEAGRQIRALEAEVERLREDAARLDWLDSAAWGNDDPFVGIIGLPVKHHSLRAAIDAARAARGGA